MVVSFLTDQSGKTMAKIELEIHQFYFALCTALSKLFWLFIDKKVVHDQPISQPSNNQN